MTDFIEKIAFFGGIALPLFNIPLITRLIKRKSSEDVSLIWAIGVWICIVLMTPQYLVSTDTTFRVFGVLNVFFFSIVTFLVVKYRRGKV